MKRLLPVVPILLLMAPMPAEAHGAEALIVIFWLPYLAAAVLLGSLALSLIWMRGRWQAKVIGLVAGFLCSTAVGILLGLSGPAGLMLLLLMPVVVVFLALGANRIAADYFPSDK